MPQGWLVAAALPLLAVCLAGTSLAQTQPDAQLEPVDLHEPLAPGEAKAVPVTASVSCEGWGELGEHTVAVFAVDPPGPEHRVHLEPAEVDLPAGPGECELGERLEASTTLVLEPSREVEAGEAFATDVVLRLEERIGGDPVREHGPWSRHLAYRTGFWAEVDAWAEEEQLELGWGEREHTRIVVAIEANGMAVRELTADAPDGVDVQLTSPEARLAPGQPHRGGLTVEDRRPPPAGESTSTIQVDVAVRGDHRPPGTEPAATETVTVEVHQQAWHATGDAIGLGVVLLAGVGLVGAAHRIHRRDDPGGRPHAPPVPAQPVDREGPATGEPRVRRALAAWLAALAFAALVWGTVLGPAVLAAGVLAAVAAVWLARWGRLPAWARARLSRLDADRVGAVLVAGGMATFALVATGQIPSPLVVPLLVAGAWALTRREVPAWTSPAVLAAGCLVAVGPLLEDGVTIGALGALARLPLGEPVALALGLRLPFVLALGLLAARCRGTARWVAAAGLGLVLVPVQLVDRLIALGPVTVRGEVLLAGGLVVASLPGLLALARRSGSPRA